MCLYLVYTLRQYNKIWVSNKKKLDIDPVWYKSVDITKLILLILLYIFGFFILKFIRNKKPAEGENRSLKRKKNN